MLLKPNYLLIRIYKRWIEKIAIIGIISLISCYIYSSKIEPNWIEVVPIELTIPNLTAAFDGFKIAQISDIHFSRFMPESRFEKIVRLVNQQQPDAIVITGDIITKYQDFDSERLVKQLSELHSQECTLAVLGNHDHWRDTTERLKQILQQSQINNLENQVYTIQRNKARLTFAGIDDLYVGKPNFNRVIRQLPARSVAILLVHEPDFIDTSAKTHKFALQLSGHSHGGQIKIPFLEPLILPHGGRKYFAGLYRVENTWEYTNRGLGMTGIPFRFNSRPEITVFSLKTAGETN